MIFFDESGFDELVLYRLTVWHCADEMVTPGPCALHQNLPRALQLRYPINGLPQLRSSSNLSMASVDELWRANWCPQYLHASGTPDLVTKIFHIRRTHSSSVPDPCFAFVQLYSNHPVQMSLEQIALVLAGLETM